MKKFTAVILSLVLFFTLVSAAFASGTAYYVDPINGSDSNSGTSPESAWQSLEKASSVTYSAGDRILLKRGETFRTVFDTRGSGTEKAPITVSCYGKGSLPVIINDNNYPCFIIHSVSNWVIENIEFTAPEGVGAMYIAAHTDQNVENIIVRKCVFRDISPDDESTGSAAISINTDGSAARIKHIHFDELKFYNVSWGIHTNGINVESYGEKYKNPDESYNSDYLFEHIYIDNAKCGGIVISAVQDCTVRNCRVLNSATAENSPYAPLWMHHTNRTVIEYCEIAGSTNRQDGMAIDFDGWTTNSTYRYIYSHDNNRFMRNCVFDSKTKNSGNSVYNCVSVNDGKHVSHSAFLLISKRKPSLSRMFGFSFHDNIIVGGKPVIWAGTKSPDVYNITFSGKPFNNFFQRIFNFFALIRGFNYSSVEDAELNELIARITADLPEIYNIGDSNGGGIIPNAVYEGYTTGNRI